MFALRSRCRTKHGILFYPKTIMLLASIPRMEQHVGHAPDMDDATHSYGGSSTQKAYDMMHKERATFAQGEIPMAAMTIGIGAN
jgi:hypothetical protein